MVTIKFLEFQVMSRAQNNLLQSDGLWPVLCEGLLDASGGGCKMAQWQSNLPQCWFKLVGKLNCNIQSQLNHLLSDILCSNS